MGFVYLIGETDKEGKYKIGSTRGKSVEKRLKQLQTGCSSELYVKDSYETEHPFKLEKMLHNHFKSSNLIGEWFELNKSDVEAFKSICEEKLKVIDSLKNNPFYFNVMTIPFTKSDKLGRVYSQETMKTIIEDFRLKGLGGITLELDHRL